MEEKAESTSESTGRQVVYFAAERTLMSWIRTSLALMTLGFVVDRFGLLLRQVLTETDMQVFPKAFSLWSGVGMVIFGSIMALLATIRYLRFHILYRRKGTTETRQGILMGTFFSFLLSLMGVALAIFMFSATE